MVQFCVAELHHRGLSLTTSSRDASNVAGEAVVLAVAGELAAATLARDIRDVASATDARAVHLQSSLPRKTTLIRTLWPPL